MQTQSPAQTLASAAAAIPPELATAAGRVRRKQTFLDRFLRHRSAVLGAVVLIPLALGFVALRRARRFKRLARSSGRQEIPSLPARYRP
jgi:hypothetical protein